MQNQKNRRKLSRQIIDKTKYTFHAVSENQVAEKLRVEISKGLSAGEANVRIRKYGANTIERNKRRSLLKLLLAQFSSIIIWLLAFTAVVAWFTENRLEALAILVVLLLNAAIGFFIEWQAGRALDALKKAMRTTARVRRDGRE